MASGKKGKRTKGKTFALTDFLQETTGSIPVQPIRKTNTNWADDVDDDVYDLRKTVNVVLPTAPKASRDYDDISDKVPKEPPFCAYLSNLPYDVDEDEIADFFKDMKIVSMRIPKDGGGESSKSKGYGYVEFEDRDSLLEALVLRDTTLKNRRMRIEIAANSENDRRRGGRMDMGRDRGERAESTGDWRSGTRPEASNTDDRRGGFGRDRDSGFSRDRNSAFSRGGDREERNFSREGMRDSGFNRERDINKEDTFRSNRDGIDNRPGAWREGERNNRDLDKGFSRDRGSYRDSDRSTRYDDRDDRKGYGSRRFDDQDRNEGFTRGSYNREDRDRDTDIPNEPRERPRLVLAPRTKPIEATAAAPPAESIFGNAKPVDTSQREREIEEKLAKVDTSERPVRDTSKDRPITRDSGAENSIERRQESRDRRTESRERRQPEGDTRNVDRSRVPRRLDESPKGVRPLSKKNYDDKSQRNEHHSPDKPKSEKLRREEKRDRHDKEMPKVMEPTAPNFAANNKFAFLETEDVSD